MRLSPSFDNKLPDYSPRPSIPLQPISLETLKYSPPKLEVKSPAQTPLSFLPHQQPVDISTFFKQSSQPKTSLPTLSHPNIKVAPIPQKSPAPIQIPIKQVTPSPLPQAKLTKPVQPIPVKTPQLLVQKPPLVEKHHIFALKKVIQTLIKPHVEAQKLTPAKFIPPIKPAVKIPKPEIIKAPVIPKPIFNPPSQTSVAAPISELKTLNDQLKTILENPIFHSPPVSKPSPPAPHLSPPVDKKAAGISLSPKSILPPEPDIQELVSQELEKVIPPAPLASGDQKHLPEPIKPQVFPIFEPHPSSPPFQKPTFPIATPSAIKHASPQISPIPLPSPTPQTLIPSHFWDYFLIRVNPKLNPYKSPIRGRVILGIKITGLILLAAGIFIIFGSFVTNFSLNVIFESLSTFTISGILLFLGENLNMFFEPINPYQIREVV